MTVKWNTMSPKYACMIFFGLEKLGPIFSVFVRLFGRCTVHTGCALKVASEVFYRHFSDGLEFICENVWPDRLSTLTYTAIAIFIKLIKIILKLPISWKRSKDFFWSPDDCNL